MTGASVQPITWESVLELANLVVGKLLPAIARAELVEDVAQKLEALPLVARNTQRLIKIHAMGLNNALSGVKGGLTKAAAREAIGGLGALASAELQSQNQRDDKAGESLQLADSSFKMAIFFASPSV